MRVPDEAAAGIANATLSFADWKEGNVAPTTFTVKIAEKSQASLLVLLAMSGLLVAFAVYRRARHVRRGPMATSARDALATSRIGGS